VGQGHFNLAARATTAAPTFFKPQVLGKGDKAQSYIDGALGANNPIDYLLEEAIQEFGTWRRLGCVVSIGTGTREVRMSEGPVEERKKILFLSKGKRIFKAMKANLTDPEKDHQNLVARFGKHKGVYFRFNVPNAAELIQLDDYLQIPELESMTKDYLRGIDVAVQVQEVAKGLMEGFPHGFTLGHIRTTSMSWSITGVRELTGI
jgi:predicted acylesterase/phospholipase RssA